MSKNFVKLDMKTLNNGAASELFERGIAKVLDNIGDPNTDADKVRTVIVKFEIKPTKGRDAAATRLSMTVGLAAVKSLDGSVVLDHDGEGHVSAFTSLVKEQELPLEGGKNTKPEEVGIERTT